MAKDLAALEQEILQTPLRPLGQVDAELLFIDGQLLYHHRNETGGHERYFISPSAARVAFLQGAFDTGWMDQSVVRYGDNGQPWIVQFFPPGKHTIQLEVTVDLMRTVDGAIAHPSLKPPFLVDEDTAHHSVPLAQNYPQRYIVTLTVWLPGMVSLVQGSKVYLWAVKTTVFEPDALLFHVPIPNVFQSGSLCFGQERPVITPNTVNRLWQRWWGNAFNADLANQKSVKYPTDIRLQLIQLHMTKKRYPLKDLVSFGERSLDAVVQSLINPHH
jgi:hypothetical protein